MDDNTFSQSHWVMLAVDTKAITSGSVLYVIEKKFYFILIHNLF